MSAQSPLSPGLCNTPFLLQNLYQPFSIYLQINIDACQLLTHRGTAFDDSFLPLPPSLKKSLKNPTLILLHKLNIAGKLKKHTEMTKTMNISEYYLRNSFLKYVYTYMYMYVYTYVYMHLSWDHTSDSIACLFSLNACHGYHSITINRFQPHHFTDCCIR